MEIPLWAVSKDEQQFRYSVYVACFDLFSQMKAKVRNIFFGSYERTEYQSVKNR